MRDTEQSLINRLNSVIWELNQLNIDLQVISAHLAEQANNPDMAALVTKCKKRSQRIADLRFSISKK